MAAFRSFSASNRLILASLFSLTLHPTVAVQSPIIANSLRMLHQFLARALSSKNVALVVLIGRIYSSSIGSGSKSVLLTQPAFKLGSLAR